MKVKKYFSLPIEFTEISTMDKFSFGDETLIPVEMKVMHNGLNLNRSIFNDDVIERAKETLKNKPILGYIQKVEGSSDKDFSGHAVEITFGDDGMKYTYLEKPLGCVPESNQYEIVEEGDKKYVKCIGYLWSTYLNEGYEILKDSPTKSVSMEVVIDDYEINDDNTITINNYKYLGVTILGDNVPPAMSGAEMSVIGEFSTNFSEDFLDKIGKVNSELLTFSTNVEPESEEKVNEEIPKEEFESTEPTEPVNPKEEFKVEEKSVEEVVQIEDSVLFTLTKEEKDALDFEKQSMQSDIDALNLKVNDFKLQISELKTNLETSETKYSELEISFSAIQKELNKIYIEEKQEILDELFLEFEKDLSDVQDYVELKDNAINMEIEDVENKCTFLLGLQKRTKSTKTRQQKVGKFSLVGVGVVDEKEVTKNSKVEVAEKLYGTAAKYLNNK